MPKTSAAYYRKMNYRFHSHMEDTNFTTLNSCFVRICVIWSDNWRNIRKLLKFIKVDQRVNTHFHLRESRLWIRLRPKPSVCLFRIQTLTKNYHCGKIYRHFWIAAEWFQHLTNMEHILVVKYLIRNVVSYFLIVVQLIDYKFKISQKTLHTPS